MKYTYFLGTKIKYFLIALLLSGSTCVIAQQQSFDITQFIAPKGWKKQTSESALQLTKEDEAKGTYCMITIFKAVPGTANSKENFDLAWTSVLKEMVTITTTPEMQPIFQEQGWEAQSGYAPFESDGNKGIAVLVTSSGFEKMVNIIILTNTDSHEKDITSFLESISFKPITTKLPGKQTTEAVISKPAKSAAKADGFTFTTSNFDDGWTSTVQQDWVQVTKGNINVLIHYPNKKADAYNSVVIEGLKNAWDVLVAPRYSSASNMEFKPITGWQSIEFAEANMIEKDSRKKVYVVLFKMNYSNGSGKYLEFISPDKKTFEQTFGIYRQVTYGWEKMEKMATYNKFAIASSDLTGKWTSDFSGAIQYVNANTGLDAGMDTHASAENFNMRGDNTYSWDLGVASGQVGNIKFQSARSTGSFSVPSNWQVKFSDIAGKPRTYNAFFSCIKGLRILWLDDKPFAKAE